MQPKHVVALDFISVSTGYVCVLAYSTDTTGMSYFKGMRRGGKQLCTPWRHVTEWSYGPTHFKLGFTWIREVSFRLRSLYSARKGCGTHAVGDWVGPQPVWTLWKNNVLSLPEMEPRLLGRLYPRILCFVDRASLYNLVNRTNLVHTFIYLYIYIYIWLFSTCFGQLRAIIRRKYRTYATPGISHSI